MVERVEPEQRFIEAVTALQSGREHEVKLSNYWPQGLAAALETFMEIAVRRERESCALLAESVGEPGTAYGRGDKFDADQKRKEICLEVAAAIRARR